MAAQPSGVSATPPSFVSSENLLGVHLLCLNSQIINEDAEQDQTHCQPCGYTANHWCLTRPLTQFSVHFIACSPSPHFISYSNLAV